MEFCCCSKIFILTHAADASLIRRELDMLIGPFFKKNQRSDITPVQFSYFNKKKEGNVTISHFPANPLEYPQGPTSRSPHPTLETHLNCRAVSKISYLGHFLVTQTH